VRSSIFRELDRARLPHRMFPARSHPSQHFIKGLKGLRVAGCSNRRNLQQDIFTVPVFLVLHDLILVARAAVRNADLRVIKWRLLVPYTVSSSSVMFESISEFSKSPPRS
jgi:hypothetical protein